MPRFASKLQYSLSSMWLVTAQRRRVDGFYARCLRRILRIQPAYYSRVSNARVFELSQARPFTQQLLQKQLILLGKAARSPADSMMRRGTFVPGTTIPQIGRFVRRVGRPRQDWTNELVKLGEQKLGRTRLQQLFRDPSKEAQQRWKMEVRFNF